MSSLSSLVGSVVAVGIRVWVRVGGRAVTGKEAPWLVVPVGGRGKIGAGFYALLARREKLTLRESSDAGLLPDFGALRGPEFEPDRVHPQIRDFYEHTQLYRMEVWSEAGLWTRLFLWGLTRFVSQNMDQLNFPVSSLELSRGMSSEVLPFYDAKGRRIYTGWLRRLKANGRVIYTGLYSVERTPNESGPCVKVSFPLPFGSSVVFLRPSVEEDGSFRLISSGNTFGDAGFYRLVRVGRRRQAPRYRVRYLSTLRETFHLYVDDEETLRTDHLVRFCGLTILRLHYKMERQVAA